MHWAGASQADWEVRKHVGAGWLPYLGPAEREMTAELRDRELRRCCHALDQVAADAPTLCEGWAAHDLAVHLWTLKRDPLGWPGIVVPALAAMGSRRADHLKCRWPYAQLVTRLRAERGGIACMPLDRFEGHRHALGEYFVHTQDVVRANGLDEDRPDHELEAALWLRVQVAARQLHRRLTPGLVLQCPDGRSAQVTGRAPLTVVTGAPSELMCWVFGREDVADVTVRR